MFIEHDDHDELGREDMVILSDDHDDYDDHDELDDHDDYDDYDEHDKHDEHDELGQEARSLDMVISSSAIQILLINHSCIPPLTYNCCH